MICTVFMAMNGEWAVAFYDEDGNRNNRKAEFFDDEMDALNRCAELMACEGMRFVPSNNENHFEDRAKIRKN